MHVAAVRRAAIPSRPRLARSSRRLAGGVGLALCVVVGLVSSVGGVETGTVGRKAGDVTLVPYVLGRVDGSRVEGEFGRLLVPENRHNPASRLIEIAFVRLKGQGPAGAPPFVFLAGGPGVSGIDNGRSRSTIEFYNKLRQIGDVILLDQRSTGLSLPKLDCLEPIEMPLDRPVSAADRLEIIRQLSRRCAQFWTSRGVDLKGYTTEESADDVDALRQALGLATINIWGSSYGSHLALSTIRRHGDHIHRAVIAAVEGPDHTIKLPSNTQKALEHIGALVAQDPELRKDVPDFLGLLRAILTQLEQHPVTVAVPNPAGGPALNLVVGTLDLQKAVADQLGDVAGLSKLPARLYAMSKGDFSWLGTVSLGWRRAAPLNAMFFHMDCASGLSQERAARIKREARETLLADVIDFPHPDVCDAWGSPDLGPAFRSAVHSNVPVLFISGTIDGRTPISNTEEIAAGFPNKTHVIVEGLSHTGVGLYATPEVQDAIVAHLSGKPVSISRTRIAFRFEPIAAETPKY